MMAFVKLILRIALLVGVLHLNLIATEPATVAVRKVAWESSHVRGRPEPPLPFKSVEAFPQLQFKSPVTLTNVPGGNRILVVQVAGQVLSFVDASTTASMDLMLDLREVDPKVRQTYGLTLHPKFPDQPYVYVCYVREGGEPDGSVISRFTVTDLDPPRADPSSEYQLIRWRAGGHNGCSLKFGPDNYLYISTGDGTGPNPPDTLRAGQDVSNLLSSILRIDVDRTEAGRNYGIPADNPFIDFPDARPEIYAFGFRNPWKMSFDRRTGDLWVGDVGWDMWELVFRVERGGNYGWSVMEGSNPILPNQKRGPGPILPPVTQHHHSEARSITGGFVYHGKELPSLSGAYVYGDYNTGKIWALRYDGKQMTDRWELANTSHQIVGWGETQSGELYYADYQRTDRIYKLAPNNVPDQSASFPRKLSETGLFRSLVDLQPEVGVEPYHVNASLWEDNSRAIRHLALPGNSQIDNQKLDEWVFPENTVVARTVLKTVNGVEQRIETQILHRDGNVWRPYAYRWNASQNDAALCPPQGDHFALGEGLQHGIHSRVECRLCHTKPMGVVLGLQFRQLHGTLRNAGLLDRWQRDGILKHPLPDSSDSEPHFVDPYQITADLSQRARSYLHVNCVSCHRPGGGGPSPIHLEFGHTLQQTKLVNVAPVQGDFGIAGAKIVVPGHPLRSILFYRMAKVGGGHMPHLGGGEPDEAGLRLIHDWISSLPSSGAASPHPQAVEALLETPQGTLELAWRLRQPGWTKPQRQQVIKTALASSHAYVRDLMEPFYPVELRKPRLGTQFDYTVVLERTGQVKRGREIFLTPSLQCVACHRVERLGNDLGPPVEQFTKKYRSARQMLDAIVRPSVEIDPKYQAHQVLTQAGDVIVGRLIQEAEDVVTLRTSGKEERSVLRDQIEAMQPSEKSLMPEYLLQALSPQDVADLIAYLLSFGE